MLLPPSVVMDFSFFHFKLYSSTDFSASLKISMPIVVSCLLGTIADFLVFSNLPFIFLMNNNIWDVTDTSIDASSAIEKHTNLLALSLAVI